MVLFKGTNGESVEFGIVDYKLPKEKHEGPHDHLSTYFKVSYKDDQVTLKGISLSPSNVQDLIEWFFFISNVNKTDKDRQAFSEADLLFIYRYKISGKKKILIQFNYGKVYQKVKDAEEYIVELNLTNAELKQYANDLKKELIKFPGRPHLFHYSFLFHCIEYNIVIKISYKDPNDKVVRQMELNPYSIFYWENKEWLCANHNGICKIILVKNIKSIEKLEKNFNPVTQKIYDYYELR
jgi:hypothetical protein